MKKFFIILCGILVTATAMGASRSPDVKTDYADDWKVGTPYSTDVSAIFTPQSMETYDGTYGHGEGAIVAFVANAIYKNGGYFCATQIQAANENLNIHSWIDYYSTSDFKCKTVCKPGYTGDMCSEIATTDNTDCDTTNFKETFFKRDILDKLKTTGKSDGRFTEQMQVFYHKGGAGSGSERSSFDVVLGVLEVKEHGLVVAPVQIEGRRTGTQFLGNRSYIRTVMSNNRKTLLCADGFEPNSNGTDCVKTSWCDTKKQLDNLCEGYTSGYNSEQHKLVKSSKYTQVGTNGNISINRVATCYYFTCAANGYGFKSVNDKTCVECEGGALAYIKNDGTCGKCTKGEIAKNTHDGCWKENEVTQYSKDQMKSNENRQCWLETDGRKFSGCVHECPGTTPCYISGNCKACD